MTQREGEGSGAHRKKTASLQGREGHQGGKIVMQRREDDGDGEGQDTAKKG